MFIIQEARSFLLLSKLETKKKSHQMAALFTACILKLLMRTSWSVRGLQLLLQLLHSLLLERLLPRQPEPQLSEPLH